MTIDDSCLPLSLPSAVGEGWKTLTVGHCLKVFSTIQGKTVARHFCNFSSEALQFDRRRHNYADSRPCAHVAESGPRAGLQVPQNSGSRMFMLRVETLSVRDRH